MEFSLEDLEMIEGENSTPDDGASDAVEIFQAGEEVESACRLAMRIEEIADNIHTAIAHLKKFKFTGAGLNLLNKNNRLGRVAGVKLPTCESDDESGDIQIDVEVVLESLMDQAKSIKAKIIEWFKNLARVVRDFFRKYFGVLSRLEKRLNKVKTNIISKIKDADRNKFDGQMATTYKYSDFKSVVNVLSGNITDDMSKDIDEATKDMDDLAERLTKNTATLEEFGKEFAAGIQKVFKTFAKKVDAFSKVKDFFGVEIDIEEAENSTDSFPKFNITFESCNKDMEKERDTYGKLGWSVNGVASVFNDVKEILKVLKNLQKMADKADMLEKKAVKAINNETDKWGDFGPLAADVLIYHYQKFGRFASQLGKKIGTDVYYLLVHYCTIAESIKIK